MKKKVKKKIKKNKNFGSFRPIFDFELKRKRPLAELKIFQLELWLEPARLGLITSCCLSITISYLSKF